MSHDDWPSPGRHNYRVQLRAALMPRCVLLPYDEAAGCCRACGIPTAKAWCGPECRRVFETNHYWSAARHAAVVRDGAKCVRCGWLDGEHYGHYTRTGQYVFWSVAALLHRRPANWLEVNHIVPLVGDGYGASCAHHQANLETVCHTCHVKITRRQRIDRSRR